MISHITYCSTFSRDNWRTAHRSFALLIILCLLAAPVAQASAPLHLFPTQAGAGPGPVAQVKPVEPETWVLEPRKPIEKKLAYDAPHYYQVTLPASEASEGKALIITIEPQGFEVSPELYGSDGNRINNQAVGDQSLKVKIIEVKVPGTYQLRVYALPSSLKDAPVEMGVTAGRYKIWSDLEEDKDTDPPDPPERPTIQREGESSFLKPLQSIDPELGSGRAHYYNVIVPPGLTKKRIEVTILSPRINLVTTLYGVEGEKLLEEDIRPGEEGIINNRRDTPQGTLYVKGLRAVVVYYVLEASGAYRLEARSKDEATGRYRMWHSIAFMPTGSDSFRYYGLKGMFKGIAVFRSKNPSPSSATDSVGANSKTDSSEKKILAGSVFRFKEGIYRAAAERLISEGRVPEALQAINQVKKEEEADLAHSDDNDPSSQTEEGRPGLSDEEVKWKAGFQEVEGNVISLGEEQRLLIQKTPRTAGEEQRLQQVEEGLKAAGQAFQNFIDSLFNQAKKDKQLLGKIYDIQESQGLMQDLNDLGEGAVAIYTLVGKEKYYVILITPDAQLVREYPIKAADLNLKVQNFRQAIEDKKQNYLTLAQDLYNILIRPIVADLQQAKARTLMWSLDGALRYLPLAALHDGKQYLLERYRNVVFTRASLARLKDRPSQRWRAIGLGVSKAVGDAAALPAVKKELEGIIYEESDRKMGGILPGTIKLNEAFTFDALRQARRQLYAVVHIASHFQFNPGSEKDSFLLLGDGDRVNLLAIKAFQNIFGGVDLLTLSACDTAVGSTGADGREVEGLAVIAQRAGAKSIIATLWPVADESTAQLMQEFYRLRETQPGTPKIEALRQAQLGLLYGSVKATQPGERRGVSLPPSSRQQPKPASKTTYAHPFYWAPFIMIGNWR